MLKIPQALACVCPIRCVEEGFARGADYIGDLVSQGLVIRPLGAILEDRRLALVAMGPTGHPPTSVAMERPAHALAGLPRCN